MTNTCARYGCAANDCQFIVNATSRKSGWQVHTLTDFEFSLTCMIHFDSRGWSRPHAQRLIISRRRRRVWHNRRPLSRRRLCLGMAQWVLRLTWNSTYFVGQGRAQPQRAQGIECVMWIDATLVCAHMQFTAVALRPSKVVMSTAFCKVGPTWSVG